MSTLDLDLLAVGPHPDDVELFCGGTMLVAAGRGHRTGVLDLTRGELASNGTPELRAQEAAAAAEVLGLALRENLGLPDGGIMPGTEAGQVLAVAAALRRLRPTLLLCPWTEARHPDHAAAGHLVNRAVFVAGLVKVETGAPPFRPRQVLYYPARKAFSPTMVVDISPVAADKARAIACYGSQVRRAAGAAETLVNASLSVQALEARDRYFGSLIGVAAGEGLRGLGPVGLVDPVQHLRDNPFGEPILYEAER
jgi:bacillithiol biosynthesis deacetylase BshB1